MPRPKLPKTKRKTFAVCGNVNAADFRRIKRVATALGLSIAAFMVAAALEKLETEESK